MKPNYPKTVEEILRGRKYKPEVFAAMRTFRKLKPWQGTLMERKEKVALLHHALCVAYGLRTQLSFRIAERECEHGNGEYVRHLDCILLEGRLSVVTYLHEFAHAAFGPSERKACEWSVNLYRRIFPKSAAKCVGRGHRIVKPE